MSNQTYPIKLQPSISAPGTPPLADKSQASIQVSANDKSARYQNTQSATKSSRIQGTTTKRKVNAGGTKSAKVHNDDTFVRASVGFDTSAAARPVDNAPSPAKPLARKELVKRAIAHAKLDRLGGGNKSIFQTNMEDIGQLGIGIRLYFMFTKYLGVIFFIMGIIASPVLIANYFGHGISPYSVDPLSFAKLSLGNQGIHNDTFSKPDLYCAPSGTVSKIDCTWKTVDTPLTKDPFQLTWIITLSDLVYSLVFLLFCFYFQYKANKAIDLHFHENLTPAKYAIYVRGLPRDAKEEEILNHFNTLYNLTKEEEVNSLWFGCCFGRRKKVKKSSNRRGHVPSNATVVKNLDHLNNTHFTTPNPKIYLNTWVAHVSIAHPTGGLLRIFLAMERLTTVLADAQELLKILQAEPRPNTYRIQMTTRKIAQLNSQLDKKTNKLAVLNTSVKKTSTSSSSSTFDWDACECAFVTFNNLESKRRCLYDYRKSTRTWTRWFQPKVLRFRGKHALIVRPAPEPSNILWENLETTDRHRFYRRSLTNLISFLLLLISCAIISAAQSAQKQFKENQASPLLCDEWLPQVFYGSKEFTSQIITNNHSMIGDDGNQVSTSSLNVTKIPIDWTLKWFSNETCPTGINGTQQYYITYENHLINPLNVSATPPDTSEMGTNQLKRCLDRCIAYDDDNICGTLSCFDSNVSPYSKKPGTCDTYKVSHTFHCLCTTSLTTYINKYGFYVGPKRLWQEQVPCQGFIKDFITKNTLMILAASTVVVVNLVLKSVLRAFASFERHSSESNKASAIVSKLFFAQFLNTAVIVLIVNAQLGLDDIPILGQLFKGEFQDFEREWYPTVGVGLTTTMLINAFLPQIMLILQTFFISPLSRCIKRYTIRTQNKMNKLYAGPSFDISVRYPLVLNSLFVTLMFSAGSPILLFIASFAAIVTYWFDKISITRLYSVKTAYDEALGELTISLLPWSLLLHLGFSTWAYGNADLLQSHQIDLKWVINFLGMNSVLEALGTSGNNVDEMYKQFLNMTSEFDLLKQKGLTVKIVRSNVIPLFLFFVLLLVAIFLSKVWEQVLHPVWNRTFGLIVNACWRKIRGKPSANRIVPVAPPVPDTAPVSPPATSVHTTSPVPPLATAVSLTATTRASTLVTSPRSGGIVPCFTDVFRKTVPKKFQPDRQLGFEKNEQGELIRKWQDETEMEGNHRMPGELMLTWEAMSGSLKTYAIEANQKYKLAVTEVVSASRRILSPELLHQ